MSVDRRLFGCEETIFTDSYIFIVSAVRINMNVIALVLLAVVCIANTSSVEGRKRVRVKIGNHYKQHDPVHIIVNKIGYVRVRVRVRVCDRENDV